MPSAIHETLVSLFHDCPALGLELVRRRAPAADWPEALPARAIPGEFSDLDPPEYRADVAIRLGPADEDPLGVLIVEVPLDRDGDKRFAWPHYEASARARLRCPAAVLVVAIDRGIAKWCAQPIVLGPSGSTSMPLVVGPAQIPRIEDEQLARAQPELAVLSAAAHAAEADSAPSVAAALLACEGLDDKRATLYADLIFSQLGEAGWRALEALVQQPKYQYQSEFAKKYFTQGREQGRREVLQLLLHQRFGELPEDVLQRISQADMAALEQWIARVIPAKSVTDVFADG